MKMAMIVAMDEDGCIGRENNLLAIKSNGRFKSLTEADGFNAVIMGPKLGIRFRCISTSTSVSTS